MIKDCLDFHVVKKNAKIYPKVVLEIDFKLTVAFLFAFSILTPRAKVCIFELNIPQVIFFASELHPYSGAYGTGERLGHKITIQT